MSVSTLFEMGARALGYYGLMASWRRRTDAMWAPSVIITSCADTDDGAHTPAQSVTINSREGLIALRDVIDEALKRPAPEADEPGAFASPIDALAFAVRFFDQLTPDDAERMRKVLDKATGGAS